MQSATREPPWDGKAALGAKPAGAAAATTRQLERSLVGLLGRA